MTPNPSRRQLLVLGGASLCLAAAGNLAIGQEQSVDTSKPFDAGPLADFEVGTSDRYAHSDPKLFIVRTADRVFASSSICTHKRCVVERTGAGYSCKCHKSKFNPDGVPLGGPAKKPLPRYGVSIDARKHVMVDLSKVFEQDDWEKEGAFVKVAGQ